MLVNGKIVYCSVKIPPNSMGEYKKIQKSNFWVLIQVYSISIYNIVYSHIVCLLHICMFIFYHFAGTGELFLCGQNKDGQLGLNHTEDVTQFILCSSLTSCLVAQVACGWDFTIILAGKYLRWNKYHVQ